MIDEGWWPVLEIPDRKLVDYLLNLAHPIGGPKARFFLSFGFDRAKPDEIGRASLAQADALFGTDALRFVEIDGRMRLVVEGPVVAPDGRRPHVRVVWQRQATIAWRLITAVPLTR
ncbi:hypothetical protein AFCDBAGC_1378 [Methylobacterium cerastii]|uniref:DUF6883 domain-containing protein n=1 Tax=Methylobacterium cerastii TaxID=932741 RepID=A0ABQ4QEI9_9HYPH|nr:MULTISPECIES: DUF6883 domain-containing protein [Methylobacterium]TXM92871.1 hypothetical protein FV222_22920 [Methylobacterium sp. WL103]TXM93126.1 hypothetical protein FV219_19680 [Methylobacterium sp. WL122]TXN83844.1 hypothetical protein FV234_05105 [Methylobacterium sp. WL8]GJD43526.1 hypothetical protein AFCDBAGC_1378 [Methylobacterium cerastii]